MDPDRWLGRAPRCGGVGAVFLLRPEADLHRVRRLHAYELAFVEGRRRLPATLAKTGIVKVRHRSADGRHWRVEAADPAAIARWIDGRPEGLRGWAKVAVAAPRFDAPPRAVPIGRFQAAIELAQEMVNRGPGSRLGRIYEGREPELPVDLAARIGEARCFALVPGRLGDTVQLVEDLLATISRRPPAPAEPR